MDNIAVAIAYVTVAFIGGLAVGLTAWYRAKTASQKTREAFQVKIGELEVERSLAAEKVAWMEMAEKKMDDAFAALAGKALRDNMEVLKEQAKGDLKVVIDPLTEKLASLDGHVRELEKTRRGAYEGLTQQLTDLGQAQARLQQATTTLSQALKSSGVRGKWGELQLRRVVEMAGMTKNIAFDEQTVTDSGRPDMTIMLPNGGVLPIDSKVPLNAYLSAAEATEDSVRSDFLDEHVRAMRSRIKELGQRKYWDQFPKTPDFVVMFVPNEACLGAAFERDSTLLEYAIEQKVLISSPVNLLALLKTVAYGWQQHRVTENVMKIAEEGKELYARIAKFVEHFSLIGRHLTRSVRAYNDATGSLDHRLMPAAQRFRDLGVSEKELSAPGEIDVQIDPTLFDSEKPEKRDQP
ncbi:MAG: DNA recombination protein RmuC [Candidatus Krumholzibacteriota bacterium]|nr:DNA recombination protein RmuC [Candidatus Krumholzibacteriota bacterium]